MILRQDRPQPRFLLDPRKLCPGALDLQKLRPGAVGGVKGRYALMSEECGVDSAVPKRDKHADIFPMKYDMVIIPPGAKEVKVWNQLTAA